MYSLNYFGKQKAVFANQDDGIFSAIPITFDSTVLTLETYTANNRTFVKAGSLVKEGNTVKGITAEEYELTNGPVTGRVVLEGYVYVENLTVAAATNLSSLPKIVPIPYGRIIYDIAGASGLKFYVKVSGSVWATAVSTSDLTLTDTDSTNYVIKSVNKISGSTSDLPDNVLEVELQVGSSGGTPLTPADGKVSIAIATTAVVGASGKVVSGTPIIIEIKNGEVCIDG